MRSGQRDMHAKGNARRVLSSLLARRTHPVARFAVSFRRADAYDA